MEYESRKVTFTVVVEVEPNASMSAVDQIDRALDAALDECEPALRFEVEKVEIQSLPECA